MLARRSFLAGFASLLAAPAIVKFEALMPVSAPRLLRAGGNILLTPSMITRQAIKLFVESNLFIQEVNREYNVRFGVEDLRGYRFGDHVRINLPHPGFRVAA